MSWGIGPNNANEAVFAVSEAKDISSSLANSTTGVRGRGAYDTSLRTFTAEVTASIGQHHKLKELFLTDMVLSRRERPSAQYYTGFITMGMPLPVWERISHAATKRGMSLDAGDKMRTGRGFVWFDVSIRTNTKPFYIACLEGVEHARYRIEDIKSLFEHYTSSLEARVLCTMRLKKQHSKAVVSATVPWSLGLTCIEAYIVGTSRFEDQAATKGLVLDLGYCLAKPEFLDATLGLMGVVDVTGGGEGEEAAEEEGGDGAEGEGEGDYEEAAGGIGDGGDGTA